METVQMQCGNCNRMMAISVDDLGGQVHCPHCQAVVDAPPIPPSRIDSGQTESIEPVREAADDLFPEESAGTLPFLPIQKKPRHQKNEEITRAFEPSTEPAPPSSSQHVEQGSADNAGLNELQPRRPVKTRALAPILLIFLIPYSILATGAIVYLYLLVNEIKLKQIDPLERLPDPKPKEGGPRNQGRVQHDAPLPNKLKARLGESLTIGSLQVTPLKVQKSKDELILHLKMKNVSRDIIFNPVSSEFFKTMAGNLPYSYLEGGPQKTRIYEAFPEWFKISQVKERLFNGDIKPGEEELVLISLGGPKVKTEVNRIVQAQESLVWRVRVRRGFVDVSGSRVSATAVVGVEFLAKDIEKEI